MTKAIIDIESYIYRACAASQEVMEYSKGIYIESYSIDKASKFLTEFVDSILTRTKSSSYIVVMGSTKNFRKEINPYYKSNRKDTPRHPMLGVVTKLVFDIFETAYIPYLEADDTCRIIYEEDPLNCVIVSLDKDLKSFPCKLYNPEKDIEPQTITKNTAQFNFFKQLLMGDTCDGYQGIKGYGEKTSEKKIKEGISLEDILTLYLENNLTREDFVRTYNMAMIIGGKQFSNNTIKLYNSEFKIPIESEVQC